MNKHILVISQYFYPEEFRINDICKEWVKKGYKVTVITGIPNYPEGKFYNGYGVFSKRKEVYEGINVIRLPLIPRGSNSLMLILNYLSFVISGFFWQLFTQIEADYVFIFEVSPMTQALPGVWYAKKVNVPCYIYVQDLWPENVEIITGINNKMIINLLGSMVDYIYKRCAKIFTTSESFMEAIKKRNIPANKVEFWPQYAEDFYKPLPKTSVKEIPIDDRINIIFTGNIGEAQGLEILPRTAQVLKELNEKNVRFNIVGDGRYKTELVQEVKKKGLEDMFNFIPKQPAEKIPLLLSVCDIAFLSLTDNSLFEMTIPAKLQSYMACGIPILASALGETKLIVETSKAGLSSDPGNHVELAQNISKLIRIPASELLCMGKNARKYYEKHFNKQTLLNTMDSYFN